MALWFMDAINGNDANDGKSSHLAVATGPYAWSAVGTDYGGLTVAATFYASISENDVIYAEDADDPAIAAWFKVLTKSSGDTVAMQRVSGSESNDFSNVVHLYSTGPVKTIAKLLTLASPGDYGYSRNPSGTLMQVYPEEDPVSELVAAALKTKLETITVANGYTMDIGTVLRPASIYVPIPDDLQVVMRQPADRIAEDSATMYEHHKQEFELFLMMRCGETDTVPIDTYANRFHAAVRKALRADVSLGGVVVDLDVGDLQQVESEESIATYMLSVVATYRHADTDPYSA